MNITQIIIISILIIVLLYINEITNNCNTSSNNYEFFNMFQEENIINNNILSFNKLYYDIDCMYEKKGCFYDALYKNNFKKTNNIQEASLIMPCTYETTDKEIEKIKNKNIDKNIYGNNVRIFMLKNTDYLVSKIVLWIIIKKNYGEYSTNIMPKTWN